MRPGVRSGGRRLSAGLGTVYGGPLGSILVEFAQFGATRSDFRLGALAVTTGHWLLAKGPGGVGGGGKGESAGKECEVQCGPDGQALETVEEWGIHTNIFEYWGKKTHGAG